MVNKQQASYSQLKVVGEATPMISPWNICNKDSVLRTLNAVGTILNLYQSSAPVKGTPDTGRMCLNIVNPAMSMAERTIILMPFTWSSMNPKMVK